MHTHKEQKLPKAARDQPASFTHSSQLSPGEGTSPSDTLRRRKVVVNDSKKNMNDTEKYDLELHTQS